MSEAALFFDLSSQRLRSRARWASIVLGLAIVLPYEVVDGRPQWIFQLLSELPLAAVIAAFAPTLAAASILVLARRARRPTSLAVGILASLATAALLVKIGADAAAWDVLRLPSSFAERPTPAIVALSLAAAGANLTFKPHARKAARLLFAAAFIAVALYYGLPARGEAPLATVLRALSHIDDLPNVRFKIGLLFVAAFALFPLLAVLATFVHMVVPAKGEQSILGLVAAFGLPAFVAFLVYRAMLMAAAEVEALAMLGGATLLVAIVALITASVEVLVDAATSKEIEQPEGLPLPRASAIAVAAAGLVAIAQVVLARPPSKGVDWKLAPATKEAEELFAQKIPTWSATRARWDAKLRRASGAEELVALKGAARDMRVAAESVDKGLAYALDTLAKQGDELDVAGRRWYRLVADVNEASRRASLPFYLDPTVHIYQTKEGLLRTFRVHSYRIAAVHPVRADGRSYATLHVRALSGIGGHGARLGFSRDLQPYALVVLDEIEAAEKDLLESAQHDPPRCGIAFDAGAHRGLSRCGAALRDLLSSPGFDLRASLVTATERHELQHQIDGPHLALSEHVLQRMTGYAEPAMRQANRELSAYLAEMTSSASPKLGLVHMTPWALVARGGAEHHVAMIVLASLTGRAIPRAERGEDVDTVEVAKALDELFGMDDALLRARAAIVWKRAFGRSLPEVKPE